LLKRVTLERLKRGLTQQQLADELGTHFTNIAKFETGTFVPLPTSALAKQLERMFRLTLDELLADMDPSQLATAASTRP
jgi:ribosome-binding protein aMBF1 (putative translation factor)